MASRLWARDGVTLEKGVVVLYAKVTTTTSGTIGVVSSKGMTITKTATKTGRYTVALDDKYNGFLGGSVLIEGSADAAYGDGKGSVGIVRGVAVTAAAPLLYVQFTDADTNIDAELEDAASFYLVLHLKNGTV